MSNSEDHPFLSMPGLAEPTKRYLQKLLSGDLIPVGMLNSLVEAYLRVIRGAAKRGQPVNLALGEAIAHALICFLAEVDGRMAPEDRLVVQAAVRYFVLENDAMGHDLGSEDGLFDDARVVNAMLRWFGRDDLLVRCPEPASARRTPTMPRRRSPEALPGGSPD